MNLNEKEKKLDDFFKAAEKIAVAFSAGVDSTFLLEKAQKILGENVLALTVRSAVVPAREIAEAVVFCKERGIEHEIVDIDETKIEGFSDNPKDRCYLCKRAIFSTLKEVAGKKGFSIVCEGTNADDTGDYRPGMRAIEELGIKSPLKDCGITKAEIRAFSKEMGLKTHDKPSSACLASRIAYGEKITKEKLSAIEKAESFLHEKGFSQVRVRVHGDLARVEILPEDFERFDGAMRFETAKTLKALGFKYVALDMTGYETGSMNKAIEKNGK